MLAAAGVYEAHIQLVENDDTTRNSLSILDSMIPTSRPFRKQ